MHSLFQYDCNAAGNHMNQELCLKWLTINQELSLQ